MAVSATTVWRVRIGGNDVNAGCFDPMVVGAGVDYTEQDAAQLTLTDLASAGASITLSSATGGFTAAMVGNGIRLSGGTGFTAGLYIIAGFTSSNAVTLDRAPSTGAATGATGHIGGALGGVFGHNGAVPGNVVFIRGQGSNEPTDIDYTVATPGFNTGYGLAYIGYNGRPKIGHNGKVWNFLNQYPLTLENLYFVQTVATNTALGVYSSNQSNLALAYNCVFDQGGIDATQATFLNIDRCSFINTGAQTAGARPIISVNTDLIRTSFIRNSLFKDLRSTAIYLNQGQCSVTGNVIMNCAGSGIVFRLTNYFSVPDVISGNTVFNCTGHGIEIQSTTTTRVYDNLVSGVTGANYGLYVSDGIKLAVNLHSASNMGRNNFHNCSNISNVTLPASTLEVDPQFISALNPTPTNTALRVLNGVGAL